MSAKPSASGTLMTWFALLLTAVLLVGGAFSYGLSLEIHQRFWSDLLGRLHGPMTFRLFLQPTMAFIAAFPDGISDAREGHSSFFWTRRTDLTLKRGRLRQALHSVTRVMLLGISMDVIYQFRVFDRFYPAEAVVITLLLAIIPYFIFRMIIERVARWRLTRNRIVR